jgi:inner membrane protein
MAALLVVMYGFIYTILQLEDMALLVGSVGLFVVLSGVMFWSRKVDWYAYSDNRSLPGKE